MNIRLIIQSKRDGMTGNRFASQYALLLATNGFLVPKVIINGYESYVVDVNSLEEYIKLVDIFIKDGHEAYISLEVHNFRLLVIEDKLDNE